MSALVDWATRRLTRTGLDRGLRGSNAWLVLATGAIGVRVIRRIARPRSSTLFSTELVPGDRFEVRSIAGAPRRRRRGR